MSAGTSIREQKAAAKQHLTIVRDEAAARLSAHKHTTKANASQFAEMEAIYVANATYEALGLEPAQDLPDANVMEKLRASEAVAEPVRRQLAANLEKAEKELKAGESEYKEAVGDHLRQTALAPALDDLGKAFDALRGAAVNAMAAHHLAYRKFNDRAPLPNNALELYGPVSEWLFAINMMEWPNYPYRIRPDWLPENGCFWPDELPGVAERVAQLLAEVERVPA